VNETSWRSNWTAGPVEDGTEHDVRLYFDDYLMVGLSVSILLVMKKYKQNLQIFILI